MKTKKRLFGTKEFYKMSLSVALPIMIQNGITNFVGLLDNIMVGQVGTEQMSGIAIVNQLLLVFNLAIFGAISGAGIFTAQFFGQKNDMGVRYTFRFKIYICLAITAIGMMVLSLFGEPLISMYLQGESAELSVEAALAYGKEYLWIMFFGLPPFAIEQAYSGTLRECGETVVSMKAGIVAIAVNLLLNYVLIFGKLGCPAFGVAGAAAATVIARYVQVFIVMLWTHRHGENMPFIVGAYKRPIVPVALTGKIMLHGFPLMVNEILWSAGMAVLNQCYSVRGLDAVAAINISGTVSNVFNVAFIAMGDAIAILVGQLLGAGKFEEAKETDRHLISFNFCMCVGIGAVLFALAPLFPQIYNTTDTVKGLAVRFLRVSAVFMPVYGFLHAAYFTMRSGGKTVITFLFDSVYLWLIAYPAAYFLSRFTELPVIPLFFAVQCIDLVKCAVGFVFLKKGVWINNIVGKTM